MYRHALVIGKFYHLTSVTITSSGVARRSPNASPSS